MSIRATAKTMGVVQRSVRSRTKMTKATPATQIATIRFKGKAFNLISFKGTRQTKKGVSAAPWGNRRIFRHAFIATMPSGARIVVIRQKGWDASGMERSGELVSRMPIRAMLGPGIAKTAAEEKLRELREGFVRTEYPEQLEGQLEYLVERALRRR